jgi:hypothetical protein
MLDSFDDEKQGASPVDEREQKHCKRLLDRIKSFDSALKTRAEGWKEARNYADGDVNDDGDDGLVRVNLVGSMLETIQPAIYAKAPEITVEIDDRINTEQYPLLNKFSKTLENALNVFLVKDAKLKKRGKTAVRSALTSTIGYLKVVYQREKKDDPIIRNRINDTQDNVERIKLLIEETKQEGGECDLYEAKMFELQQQLTALESQIEIVVSEGLVADFLQPEDVIVMDASCRDIDEFIQSTEIAHRIKMTVGAFKAQFGKSPPKGSKSYVQTDETNVDESYDKKDVDEDDKIIVVFEVWSLKDLTVYTLCEGAKQYIRPPYQPESLGEQWYPFFGLQLRRVDGKKYPRSMVEQLIELQDEYNTRRTNAKEHRRKNIPVRLVNKSAGITDDEITKINGRNINTDVIGVSADDPASFQNQLVGLPEIPYNPQMYDTSDVLFDMEKVGNTQDAASGAIRVAKTATEAEISAAGQQGRTGEALDVIEDWLTDIAIYSAQLLLQNVQPEVIKQRFGEDAIWPELDKKTLFSMVNIGIRAGSTSKPNKMRERDQWIQIMPEIQKAIETLTIAKQQGNSELSEVTINLLDETLKRFDEKLDAKSLLGLRDEEGNDVDDQQQQPQIPPEVEQAMQEMQAQLQQLQQENQALQQEKQSIAQDKEVKMRGVDIKNREVDIKEREFSLKENESINKQNAEMQESQVELNAISQIVQSNAEIAMQVSQLVEAVTNKPEEIERPETKRKTAKAVKQADGSWLMESIEVEGE